MTSGMSAKGSALGTNAPESGVPLGAAQVMPTQAAAGNGTQPGLDSGEAQEAVRADIGAEPVLGESVRTLILGIDYDGRVVQHDRNAALILARPADELLGAQLIDLTAAAQGNSHPGRSADSVAAINGLHMGRWELLLCLNAGLLLAGSFLEHPAEYVGEDRAVPERAAVLAVVVQRRVVGEGIGGSPMVSHVGTPQVHALIRPDVGLQIVVGLVEVSTGPHIQEVLDGRTLERRAGELRH